MRIDLERALGDIARAAGAQASPVPVDRLLARMHHRRTAQTVTTSVVGLGAAGAVALGSSALLGRPAPPAPPASDAPIDPAPTSEPAPTGSAEAPDPAPDRDPVAGWVAGSPPCGETFTAEPVDSTLLELYGQVTVGAYDPANGLFSLTTGGESVVDVLVTAYPPEPGTDVPDYDLDLHTYLVDDAGTIALWDPPSDELGSAATDGSGSFNVATLKDAVDCRTGQPLVGTYRAFSVATLTANAWFPDLAEPDVEVKELAPVTFATGEDRPSPYITAGELPTCGPADPRLLDGTLDADFAVTLDPAGPLDTVSAAGVHVQATVTRTGPASGERLTGVVPQAVRAVLVDDEGWVVSAPDREYFGSAQPFDVGPDESFDAEVYTWFGPCTEPVVQGRTMGPPPIGSYDLYVYELIPATGPDGTTTNRLAVGGPFPITLKEW